MIGFYREINLSPKLIYLKFENMNAAHTNRIKAAIIAGCIVSFLSFGFSATFGVFIRPMSTDLGLSREVFSLSIALQMLCWGFTQPIAGVMADRFGSARVLAVGAVFAAFGFYLRGIVDDPNLFIVTGVIVGIGTGACAFPIVIVALGKIVSAEQRSFVMGLGTASASFGMFLSAPASLMLVERFGWKIGVNIIAVSFLLILPVVWFVARARAPKAGKRTANALGLAIKTAFRDRSYICLFAGFFVCGFHVAFIGTHLPAYVADEGLAVIIGGWSLGLIGLFNIAGSFGAGWAGQNVSKKWMLISIYASRAVFITVFILVPITSSTVYLFSAIMGIVWLSTVPLTTGLVAQTQGLTFLSTLVGLVFLSHQAGSFIGAWLGGRIYDATGEYTVMWWTAVVLGLLAALIHVPISERARKLV
jgi:MFS family permease